MAKSKNFADIELKAELHKALIYEITQKKDESLKSLEQAYKIYPENKLDSLYSSYCIRYSSFHNIFGKKEIAHTYAMDAVRFAKLYGNNRDLTDGYLLLTMLLKKEDYKAAIFFGQKAVREFYKRNDHIAVVSMYNNISNVYFSHQDLTNSKAYNDSALDYAQNKLISNDAYVFIHRTRSGIFEKLNQYDSAFYNLKKENYCDSISRNELELMEIQTIIEK